MGTPVLDLSTWSGLLLTVEPWPLTRDLSHSALGQAT